MNINNILISKKSVYIVFFIVCLLLSLPLIAMQFTHEVNWKISDFLLAGVLLSFFGYLYEVLTKTSQNKIKKIVIGLMVFCVFIFVWVSLI